MCSTAGVCVRRGGGGGNGDGGDFVEMSRWSTNIAKVYASTTYAIFYNAYINPNGSIIH